MFSHSTLKKIYIILLVFTMIFVMVSCSKPVEEEPLISVTAAPVQKYEDSTDIIIPMPAGVTQTNPLLVNTRTMSSIYNLVFESLFIYDSTGEPVGDLVDNYTVDEAGTTWTLQLRNNITWHDGRPFSGEDVIFTFQLLLEVGELSPYFEVFKYIETWDLGENSFEIILKSRSPFFGILNSLDFPILPMHKGYSVDSTPTRFVGTGPYIVKSFSPIDGMVLVANEDWWRMQPEIRTITAKIYPDDESAVAALVLRQVDAVQTSILTTTQYRDSGDANAYEYATNFFEFIAVNNNSGYMADARVRKGIAYSLDRSEILTNVYINHGIAVDTPVSPTSWLYEGNILKYDHDLMAAARMFDQAGWKYLDDDDPWLDVSPQGLERDFILTLLVNEDHENPQRFETANILVKQLKEVGILVVLDAQPWDEYVVKLENGSYDLALAGIYLTDIPDLYFLLGSEGEQNYSSYSSVEMDALLGATLRQDTAETLKYSYSQLQSYIIEELPVISLFFRTHTLLTTKAIVNVSDVRENDAYNRIAEWGIDSSAIN